MRTPVASLASKFLLMFFAATLAFGLLPAQAFAVPDSLSLIPEGDEGAVRTASSVEEDQSEVFSHRPSEDASSADAGSAAFPSEYVEHTKDAAASADGIINQEMPLGTVLAQAESTRSYFLAQTFESTKTVPVVSAKLPLDSSGANQGMQAGADDGRIAVGSEDIVTDDDLPAISTEAGSGGEPEGGEGSDEFDLGAAVALPGVAAESTVVGSFTYLGMAFAVEPSGDSVALMAVDYSKLPEEFIRKQVIVIPDVVTADGVDHYSVTRIADDAFASLTKEIVDPDRTGCIELLSDEELLTEAGIDPADVAELLADDGAVAVMRDGENSGPAQDGEDAGLAQDDGAAVAPFTDATLASRDERETTGADDGTSEADDTEEASSSDVRTIVSMEGDVATLDDGSTYTFVDPLAGCTGILALGIPASVSKIGDDAFLGFETLQYLVVSDDNPEYASYDGALYSADLSQLRLIPEGRLGAVRIASHMTDISPDALSHYASVDALVVDAESELHISLLADAFDSAHLKLEAAEDEFGSTRSFSEVLCARLKQVMLEEQVVGFFSDVEFLEYELYDASSGVLGVFVAKGFYLAGEGYRSASAAQTTPIETSDGDNIPLYWRDTIGKGGVWVGDSGVATRMDDHGWAHLVVYDSKTRQAVPDGCGAWFSARDRVTKFRGYYGSHPSTQSTTIPSQLYWLPRMTVTWDLAGGNVGGVSTLAPWYVIEGGGKLSANTDRHIALPIPTRYGYSFAGWYSSLSFAETEHATMNTVIMDDTTLYAKWTPNRYAVSFNANGGSGGQSANVTATYDAAMPAISAAKPTRAGYTFGGWYDTKASSGGTQYYTASGTSARTWNKTAATTLYARWTPNTYTIAYDANGGTVSGGTTSYNIESSDFALPTSGTRTGYTFSGWTVSGASGAGLSASGVTTTVKKGTYGNLTATAKWTPNTYAVSFNANGGSGGQSANVTATYDAAMPTISAAAPTRAGYTFGGWYDTSASSGGTQYYTASGASARAWDKTAATTLYARWTANPYTAHLHANDGTGEGGFGDTVEHAVTYDAAVADAGIPRRYGYAFSGYWTKNADGSKAELYFDADGAYVKDAVWKGLSDVDLYACWTLMGDLEVPISSPSTLSFTFDRATGQACSSDGSSSSYGLIRSSMPEEVPVASLALEALRASDGMSFAEKLLGKGNPEECAMEVVFSAGASASKTALLRFASPAGSAEDETLWEFPSTDRPLIPSATSVASGTTGDGIVTDDLGNLARAGELSLSYALKTLPGFDVYKVPLADGSEDVARIVFTVDLTGVAQERF